MEPINYILDVQNPIEQAMRGYGMGRADIEQRQVMQEREQSMGLRATAENRAAQDFEMRRAEADRQRAQAEAGQAELLRLMELGDSATTDDYTRAFIANPAIRQDLSSFKEMLDAPKLETMLRTSQNLYAAAKQGNVDAVRNQLTVQFEAAKNSGDEAMAATYGSALEQLNTNPEMGMNAIATTTGFTILDFKGPDYFEAINKNLGVGGEPAAGASPLGKIAQDVEAGLIPKSVLDAAIKLETQTSEGTLTLQQKIAEEARLRGEYVKRTEDLSAAERNFSIIETSALDQSGAGDIALVTSFMKMLDPGSVVRETEFATAANAGGLLARLSGTVQKIEDGKFLSEQQRTDFKRLAGEYLNAAKTQEQGVQRSYQLIVDNYGLDPVNVFGARAATTPAPDQGATGALPQSFLTNPNVINAAAAAGISPEDMWNVMTPEQRARYGG
jgi:hypothetical protein